MKATLPDLLLALQSEELVPVFQPQVDLNTGTPVGFEVLARWNHPTQGLILPANFISIAETNGLIGQFSRQILSKAFAATAEALPESMMLAVNLSPVQLHHTTFPAQLRCAAEDAGFSLDRLIVEVTESAILSDLDLARQVAKALRDQGCRLAIDDFGTGYSSLLQLTSLPFTDLKIDRSFIASMSSSDDARKIVSGVIRLGQSLALTTVGEGVENQEQAETLFRMGCDQGQGWLFGRPHPAFCLTQDISVTSWQSCMTNPLAAAAPCLPRTRSFVELQAVYETIPVPFCLLDRELRYVRVNTRYAKMIGRPAREILGKTAREIGPRSYPRLECLLHRVLQGESFTGPDAVIVKSSRPDEPEYTFHISYEPTINDSGDVVGVSVAVIELSHLPTLPRPGEQRLVLL